ncbi:fluoride efflux transporter CrcB [Actinocrispum wychmicini]|uniref:Fluoride-specific ion channel FluC n=1 Tax=Actinocrispum wychmicini TaxID=1213861 RepID=A0A4R2K7H8_9PSEU|nr:fluoride efflux transporter CrcB [Actinocrispum wychmicini]TCO65926.1 CrcB protein [Actinocrispum wychmicini]
MTVLLVFVGAMVGAPLRYLTDRAVQKRHETTFPWGTFTVNVTGCLILGALSGAGSASATFSLLGTGFCGALTTYSTFSYETFRLAEQKEYFYAAMNVVVSIVAGVGAAVIAYMAVM